MNMFILIIAALLPAILLWFYIWQKDSQPEPTSQLVKAVCFGVVICIPVAFLEVGINSILFGAGDGPSTLAGVAIEAFFVAAIPEECVKLLALWLILRRNPYFDEHFDGIVYAVCVGLGFAAVENIFYLFGNIDNWQSVAITRALLAVPGHYAFAVLMGYYYSLHHFVEHSFRNWISILLIPILVHGCYDVLALTGKVSPILGGLCFFALIYFCIKIHKVCRKKILAHLDRDEKQGC